MLAELFLKLMLAALFRVGVEDGYATQFGHPGDEWAGNGGAAACTGRLISQDELVCAHRWLPCGSKVRVVNPANGRSSLCVVEDRGPYGVDVRSQRWRGILDMAPHAARSIALGGRAPVWILYVLPPASSRAYDVVHWLSAVGKPAMPGWR